MACLSVLPGGPCCHFCICLACFAESAAASSCSSSSAADLAACTAAAVNDASALSCLFRCCAWQGLVWIIAVAELPLCCCPVAFSRTIRSTLGMETVGGKLQLLLLSMLRLSLRCEVSTSIHGVKGLQGCHWKPHTARQHVHIHYFDRFRTDLAACGITSACL